MAKKKATDRMGRGITALMDREAANATAPDAEKYGKLAVEWLKKQAIMFVGHYHRDGRHYNCGDVVRGLELGNGWGSREKYYSSVMKGLKRAEELGFVSANRHGSPMGFKYVGPEIADAEKALKAKKKAESDRYERIVKRLRIKGIEASTDHRDNCTVVMTAGAFEIVAARAGVSLV